MTLAEYFKCVDHGFSDLEVELKAKEQLFNERNKRSAKEIEDLETYLNSIFYPTGDDEAGAAEGKRIREMILQAYKEKFDAELQNFSFDSNNVEYNKASEDLPQLVRGLYEKEGHSKYIMRATVENRLRQVKDALKNMRQETATEELKAIQVTLNSLQQGLESLLAEYGSKEKISVGDPNSSVYEQVNYLDKLWFQVSTVLGGFTPADYGRVLEWALQAASAYVDRLAEDGAEKIAKSALERMMNPSGSERTEGGKSLINLKDIDLSKEKDITVTPGEKSSSYIVNIPDENGSFISIEVGPFNENTAVQGKMDVNFILANKKNGTNTPFRISAKNWSHISGHDLGETSVAYALLRQVGLNQTHQYSYIMGENDDSEVDNAHDMAQIALLLDILMGFAQKNNYADTLVINDRASSRIIVKSIPDLVHNLLMQNDFKISQYEKVKSDIRAKHRIMWKALVDKKHEKGKSKNYTNLSAAYLNSVKIALSSKDIGLTKT